MTTSRIKVTGRVIAVLRNVITGEERVYEGHNLVTTAGLQWLMKKAADEAGIDPDFGGVDGRLEFGTAGNAPAASSTRADVTVKVSNSIKEFDSGYPKRDDDDVRNTASNLDRTTTFLVTYEQAEANSSGIDRAIIHGGGDSPGASEAVLCYSTFTSFTKTSNDTLAFFWNIQVAAA